MQMCIANQHVLLYKNDFVNWDPMSKFVDKLPESFREEFKAFVAEGRLVTKTSLQSALDI